MNDNGERLNDATAFADRGGDRVGSRCAVDAVSSRFLFNGQADDVLRRCVECDMEAARLSRTFRAYYLVRSLLPLPLRQLLQRHRRINHTPGWGYPDACIRSLAECIAAADDGITTVDPWPDETNFAFVLTHDVETADGMRRIARIADLEERLGYRSSWNIVPYKYPVDRGLIRDLRDRGFEIGIHGYNHDGRLFSSRSEFDRRVPEINAALESYGAVGFRAPMVHRNLAWLQALKIEYDASCFDADPYQAMPGGVGGVWPFVAGRFVELPYTLPQDHTLFINLNERDGRIWHDKLQYISALRGLALLITHPDYLDSEHRVEMYRTLLHNARDMAGAWHALPKEVAAWWRDRDRSRVWQEPDGHWHVAGPAANRGHAATVRAATAAADTMHDGSPAAPSLEWSAATPRRPTSSARPPQAVSESSSFAAR